MKSLTFVQILVLACFMLLTLTIISVYTYTPCKTQEDCTDPYCRKLPNGAKLGNCFRGLCKCYDEYGNGEIPMNSSGSKTCEQSTRTKDCYRDCHKADTKYVDNGNGYLCANEHCYCNFKLKGIIECTEDGDCQDFDESTRCMNGGIARCNLDKGTCECGGKKGSGSPGKLSECLCVDEMFCEDLCAIFPNPTPDTKNFKGKLCFKTDNPKEQKEGICYCPTEG